MRASCCQFPGGVSQLVGDHRDGGHALPWDPHGRDGAGLALEIVAGVAAVVVMTYAGAVLARPRSIPYWNSPAVPLQFPLSSAAMSVAIVMVIEVIAGEPVSPGQMVPLAVLTAALLVTMVVHLLSRATVPGKQESLERLLRGKYRNLFAGFVVAAGTAVPLVLPVWARPPLALGTPWRCCASCCLCRAGSGCGCSPCGWGSSHQCTSRRLRAPGRPAAGVPIHEFVDEVPG